MMVLTCGCEVEVAAPARIVRPCEQHGRISLRDRFAGQALQGWIARGTVAAIIQTGATEAKSLELLADGCYQMADAMLAAREKVQP